MTILAVAAAPHIRMFRPPLISSTAKVTLERLPSRRWLGSLRSACPSQKQRRHQHQTPSFGGATVTTSSTCNAHLLSASSSAPHQLSTAFTRPLSRFRASKPRYFSSSNETITIENTSTTNNTIVGIFIDLDNMSETDQKMIDRTFVAQRMRPLKSFAHEFLGAPQNDIEIKAYANRHTQTYKANSKKKKKKSAIDDDDNDDSMLLQEYWEPSWGDNDDDPFAGAMVQTGYDEAGELRCGICGQKMKLNKKDKARGLSLEGKLKKHMKMLHDQEQRKRTTRLNQLKGGKGKGSGMTKKAKKFLESKEGMRMQKYKAAQVGLGRGPSNDWFPILKEEGVARYSCHNVDAELIKAVKKWITNKTNRINRKAKQHDQTESSAHLNSNIVVMVVSEDSDFCSLLDDTSRRNNSNDERQYPINFLTASATWNSSAQTEKLVNVSDFVLTLAADDDGDNNDDFALDLVATTERGKDLLHSTTAMGTSGDDNRTTTAIRIASDLL